MKSQTAITDTRERLMVELQSVVTEGAQKEGEIQRINQRLSELTVRRVQLEAAITALDDVLRDDEPPAGKED